MLCRRVLSSAAATLLLTLYLRVTPSSRIINSVGFITHQLISNRFHCLIELAAFLSYTAATPRGRLRASWVQRCRGTGIFKCQKLHTAVSAGLCFCDSVCVLVKQENILHASSGLAGEHGGVQQDQPRYGHLLLRVRRAVLLRALRLHVKENDPFCFFNGKYVKLCFHLPLSYASAA